MKVAIGAHIQTGPWGGGNSFAASLHAYLLKCGVEVVFDLKSRDIDVIILTEPRSNLKSSAFTDVDILRYLINVNRNAVVVHRINECDERKGTKDVNRILFLANQCADHTVYISGWLRDLFEKKWPSSRRHSVILNGADINIFNNKTGAVWNKIDRIKIVTHHWGGNWMKGFDIYERLDNLLGTEPYKNIAAFTYIGSLPDGFTFRNTKHIEPLSGGELARCLSQHHIYLTASLNEPAGMHHIEGALCGLPLLYRNSGALPGYCTGYGVMFDFGNFEEKLHEIMKDYDHWAECIMHYPHTADMMCREYHRLFLKLIDQREQLVLQRTWNEAEAYKMMMRAGAAKLKNRIRSRFG